MKHDDEMQKAIDEERRAIEERLKNAPTRRDDGKTSVKAAKGLKKGLKGVRAQVHEILVQHPGGLTQSQVRVLCEKAFGVRSESTYRKRLPELQDLGLARKTLDERTNGFGNKEAVWVPVTPDETP